MRPTTIILSIMILLFTLSGAIILTHDTVTVETDCYDEHNTKITKQIS